MGTKRRIIVAAALALFCIAGSRGAHAAPPASKAAASVPPTHYWYDGHQKRPLWLDDTLVLEVGASGKGAANDFGKALRTLIPAAQVVHRRGQTRIWKVPPAGARSLSALRSAAPSATFTPVLRDRVTRGRMRGLPGNVVVQFPAGTSGEAARRRLAAHNLKVVQRADDRTYLVAAPAGLDSLSLANALFETGDFAYAAPDWWVEAVVR